jgi:branched-chain amino acid transport system substrate-binding protein
LFEVVSNVIGRAADLDDADAIVAAIKATNMSTIVGDINWSNGPVPNVSKTPLVSGQWQDNGAGVELVITNNAHSPNIPVGGELKLLG